MRTTGVFDVSSFCESHKISRSFLYKLIAEGRGPRLMKLGRRTLISVEAAAEWRARMEGQSPQPMDAAQN
jgi:predicted DNA-binding transcriptional regulator AlpA